MKLHEGDEIDVFSKTNYVKRPNKAREKYTALFPSTKHGKHLTNIGCKGQHELPKEKSKIGQKTSRFHKWVLYLNFWVLEST